MDPTLSGPTAVTVDGDAQEGDTSRLESATAHAGDPQSAVPDHQDDPSAPTQARRGISLAVVVSLVPALASGWAAAADREPNIALVITGCLLALLVVAASILAVRTSRAAGRLDVLLLVIGLISVAATRYRSLFTSAHMYPSDEGRLGQLAITTLLHGHDPYTHNWPSVAAFAGNTPLMGGGAVTHYGYPPLSVEIGAAVGHLWRPLGTPGVVCTLGLALTAIVCFIALPHQWRALSVLIIIAPGPLTTFAVNGHPALLALPLLCIACHQWTRIGSRGRLGRRGVIQAGALGLACSAQQLSWFIALGLLLSISLVRAGDNPRRRAAAIAARFGAVAMTTFLIVDVPFIVTDPHAWSSALLSVLTQHAVASGQGLVMLNVVLRAQGGNLDLYSYATGLFLLASLALSTLAFSRFALVMPLIPALMFAFSTRSPIEYFVILTPVWLVWLMTAERDAIAASRPIGPTHVLLRSPRRRASALAAATLPSLTCVAVAVASPGPLHLQVTRAHLSGARLTSVIVIVINHTHRTITPSFYVDPRSHLKSPWTIISGPHALRAGQRAVLVLHPGALGPPSRSSDLRVWALSDRPMSISSTGLDR